MFFSSFRASMEHAFLALSHLARTAESIEWERVSCMRKHGQHASKPQPYPTTLVHVSSSSFSSALHVVSRLSSHSTNHKEVFFSKIPPVSLRHHFYSCIANQSSSFLTPSISTWTPLDSLRSELSVDTGAMANDSPQE